MSRAALPNVHPTAVISDEAELPADVKVGAFAVIEGPVRVGPGCVIHPHAQLVGRVTMGENNTVGSGAVIGGAPQHAGYRGEPTAVAIGNGNVFREHVTVHRGMPLGAGPGSGVTRVGDRNLFMVGSHVGHDAVIGNDCVLVNGSLLAGHVVLEDRVLLSGNTAIHQFCRVGRLALVSGLGAVSKDVPPFWVMIDRNMARSINLVGMRRAGLGSEIAAVRKAFRMIYLARPALPLGAAVARIEAELGHSPAIRELIEFIRSSKRGICGAHRYAAGDDEADKVRAAA